MQRQKTYVIRAIAHQVLSQSGPLTLHDLFGMTGIPTNELRYAIESTEPFGAVFKKNDADGVCVYEAVALDEIYGEEDFY